MSQTGSIALLIAALSADADPADWHPRILSADPERLVVSAMVLGLAPLLHWQLTTHHLSLTPRADAKLLAARQAAQASQHAMEAQLAEVLAACGGSGVPVIVLKGAYLAACVYPEDGLRPMNDIDVLVRPEHLREVEGLLAGLGYEGHYKSPEQGARVTKHTSTFRRPVSAPDGPNPYLSAAGERTVEPHTSLEESWFGLRADMTPGVWDRSEPIVYDGQAARAPGWPDLLLPLCIHLTFHLIMGWPSLVQVVDIQMVSRRLSREQWAEVASRARTRKVAGFIYAALRLAKTALHAPVPDDTLAALAAATPPRVRRHAETLSLGDVVRRTQRPPLTTMGQRIRRGFQDRAETARWAATFGEQVAVWRTLVDVARTDTGAMIGKRIKQAADKPS
ncbi:MAG: nucleotidyltransferase family protein [Chloroflexi bacterium]|nr:nucleotidyltransferase family protein [Chloroflexota bacterium]